MLFQVGTAFVTPTDGQLYDPTDGAVTVPIESPDTSDPPAERKHDDRPGGGLVGSLIVGIVDMGASLVAPYEIASGTAIAWRMKHGHVTASPPLRPLFLCRRPHRLLIGRSPLRSPVPRLTFAPGRPAPPPAPMA